MQCHVLFYHQIVTKRCERHRSTEISVYFPNMIAIFDILIVYIFQIEPIFKSEMLTFNFYIILDQNSRICTHFFLSPHRVIKEKCDKRASINFEK